MNAENFENLKEDKLREKAEQDDKAESEAIDLEFILDNLNNNDHSILKKEFHRLHSSPIYENDEFDDYYREWLSELSLSEIKKILSLRDPEDEMSDEEARAIHCAGEE